MKISPQLSTKGISETNAKTEHKRIEKEEVGSIASIHQPEVTIETTDRVQEKIMPKNNLESSALFLLRSQKDNSSTHLKSSTLKNVANDSAFVYPHSMLGAVLPSKCNV